MAILGGSGLGLSIVDRLAEVLGGEVEVESEKEEGTCFMVELPCTPAPARQA